MSTEGELDEWDVNIWALQHFDQNSAGTLLIDGEPYVPGGPDGVPHTMQDEGVDLAARGNLNFVGTGVAATDDSGNDATIVTISKLTDSEVETAYNNQVGIVSQVDAEAGVSTTPERWTPERVQQAIVAHAPQYAAIQIPGSCFASPASGGSAGLTEEEVGSNVLVFNSFLDAVDTYAMASNILAPLNFDDTVILEAQVEWSVNSTSTNDVRFTLQTAPQGEGDALNVALNTALALVDTNSAAANQRHVTAWGTLPSTGLTAGESFLLRLDRTATHASDTLAADVRVHAVRLRYTTKDI